jgi:cytochrome c oxidase subunit II
MSSSQRMSIAILAFELLPNLARAQSVLEPSSSKAAEIEWLYWVIFWVSLVAFIVVMYAFAHAATKNSKASSTPPPVMENPAGDLRALPVVALAMGITAITLIVVFVQSVLVEKRVHASNSQHALTVEVIGHQWWWEVRYPNSQAYLTVTTANEIHLPVKKPVRLMTISRDVIHSFWAPNLQGKRDVMPGQLAELALQVDNTGRYRGLCAEFCGYQHAHMAFEVVVEPEADFERWLEQQRKSAPDPQDEVTVRGRDVFLKADCIMCHTIRGTDAGSRVGPELTHVGSRRMIAAGTLTNTPGNLAGWISDPQRIKPGTVMPPHALEGDDLQALVTYLGSLK